MNSLAIKSLLVGLAVGSGLLLVGGCAYLEERDIKCQNDHLIGTPITALLLEEDVQAEGESIGGAIRYEFSKNVFRREVASCCPDKRNEVQKWADILPYGVPDHVTKSSNCAGTFMILPHQKPLPPKVCEHDCLCPGYKTAWGIIHWTIFTDAGGLITRWCRYDEWNHSLMCGPDPEDLSGIPSKWIYRSENTREEARQR